VPFNHAYFSPLWRENTSFAQGVFSCLSCFLLLQTIQEIATKIKYTYFAITLKF